MTFNMDESLGFIINRTTQFAQRAPGSDTSVLDFYENNRMLTGSIDI